MGQQCLNFGAFDKMEPKLIVCGTQTHAVCTDAAIQ